MKPDLKLSEKLFILSVNPTGGVMSLSSSAVIGITLTALVFVELMKKEVMTIDNGVVHLVNPTLQTDEIHEFFLAPIREREKDRKIRTWMIWFNNRSRKIRKLFIRHLVKKHVLRIEEKRFLFITYDKVFLMDRPLAESLCQDIETSLLGTVEPNDESIILAVMAAKSNLLSRIFPDREQRREANRKLKQMPETPLSKAVQQAIQMMHATAVAASS